MSVVLMRNVLGRNRRVLLGSILSNITATTQLSPKCLLFDDSYLNLEPLWKEKEKLKAAVLDKKSRVIRELENIKMFSNKRARILMAGTDTAQDLHRVIQIAENFIAEEALSEKEILGFTLQIIRVAYMIDQIDEVLYLFDSHKFKPFINGTFAAMIVMNKLFREKRYEAVLELFEKQKDFYSVEKSYSERAPEYFRQPIPYDQLTCVITALYAMNSRESFQKLQSLVEFLKKKQSTMNRRSLARAFLLSINQGEPEFALELVHSTACSIDLRLNLEIIALCLLNRLNDAFLLSEEMFMIRWNDSYQHQGRFFPLVFKYMKQAVDRELFNRDYLNKYESIEKKATRQNRISLADLEQYCSFEPQPRRPPSPPSPTTRSGAKPSDPVDEPPRLLIDDKV